MDTASRQTTSAAVAAIPFPPPAFTTLVASAIGGRATGWQWCHGGGNNQVFFFFCKGGRYVAKHAPHDPGRLVTEYTALTFMRRCAIGNVPDPVALDRENGWEIMEYLPGETPAPGSISTDDMRNLAEFLKKLQEARHLSPDTITLASDACISCNDVFHGLAGRLNRLKNPACTDAALTDFLDNKISPAYSFMKKNVPEKLLHHGIDPNKPLTQDRRVLSPSDLGFHNTLRDTAGNLSFLDFEYFGWDDAAKLTADFLLHPGHPLDGPLRKEGMQLLQGIFGAGDPLFATRVRLLLAPHALKWCLIMLNEFLDDAAARRICAGKTVDHTGRHKQLSKASHFFDSMIDPETYTCTLENDL